MYFWYYNFNYKNAALMAHCHIKSSKSKYTLKILLTSFEERKTFCENTPGENLQLYGSK